MNRLEELYHTEVDFIHLDLDVPGDFSQLQNLGINRRSSYMLVGPDGTVIRSWFGPLLSTMDQEFAALLEELATN